MDRDPRAARITPARLLGLATVLALALVGCAHIGPLQNLGHTVTPFVLDSLDPGENARELARAALRPLFGDTLIGLLPGTADSSHRFLGRLRDGYTADTLNLILCGDNRPGYRVSRLRPQFVAIRQGLSTNPLKILRGLVNIPLLLVRGIVPDLALIREFPALVEHMPHWGREHQVTSAILATVDSLHSHGQKVAAVINTGDLVFDGRYPAHWRRFLRLTEPLTSRVPYFPIAGNHERTDTPLGVANWRAATGLPVGSDRLYYCFDSADGWVRFIALDTNPIVDPLGRWSRQVHVQYSEEEFTWLVARVKEHVGPVIVMMHHPPFSASAHHMEWQMDPVLTERRERMVTALHDAGIAIIASGHEHSYQRALLTWSDAVLVAIVSGGAGAPLHLMPSRAESARLFSEYRVAGSRVEPANVFVAQVFNFTHLRLWFGGGDLRTYAVDRNAQATLIDHLQIDLSRYGIPRIDQHKMPLPPSKGPSEVAKPLADLPAAPTPAMVDSTAATSKRILAKPPPGGPRKHKTSVPVRRESDRVVPSRAPPPVPGGVPPG